MCICRDPFDNVRHSAFYLYLGLLIRSNNNRRQLYGNPVSEHSYWFLEYWCISNSGIS